MLSPASPWTVVTLQAQGSYALPVSKYYPSYCYHPPVISPSASNYPPVIQKSTTRITHVQYHRGTLDITRAQETTPGDEKKKRGKMRNENHPGWFLKSNTVTITYTFFPLSQVYPLHFQAKTGISLAQVSAVCTHFARVNQLRI